jgi:hypothetical protein
MTVAVCSIGCDRKASTGFPAWPRLFDLEGDYSLYFNYEAAPDNPTSDRAYTDVAAAASAHFEWPHTFSFDQWSWGTRLGHIWRPVPQFDQDQARLSSIVTARNMCIDYALLTGASHLLFIDADVIPPNNVIPALLAEAHTLVGGIVPGRGCHSALKYIFGEERTFHTGVAPFIEVRHGTCGCMMIERRVFNKIRFRFSVEDGLSEDPAYAADVEAMFGEKMWLREDVVCQHIGDLADREVAQF